MKADLDFLRPYFLGPASENADVLESLLLEFLRDHAYWRRNFHPEDGQRIDPGARHSPEFHEFEARTRQELFALSAELKRAVPFFHPRYVGHMSSDLLLPGLVAKLITTLYNPNNVSEEAAPVTLDMELRVGRQLARMFGFAVDDEAEPCAWGHLTSGGTVANYEALWNLRAVKFYPLALQAGALACAFDPGPVGPAAKALSEYSKWELLNLSIDQTIELRRDVAGAARKLDDRRAIHRLRNAVRTARLENVGIAAFFQEHEIKPPLVMVPVSAHYSWEKGMKVLGLGTAHLCRVPIDGSMRMEIDGLRACLDAAFRDEVPVLGVVGMLGTTEFGAIDPIHEIVKEREARRAQGQDFGVHVDAAWGGYLTSVFRAADGSFLSHDDVREGFRYFPSNHVYEAFRAIGHADSVTVDPHKLGYVPYSAGAFIARNREVVDFVTQQAAYVFDLGDEEDEVPRAEKLHNLGQYILEGSKSGAAAAAVHVTHRVLPLDVTGLGRLLRVTIRTAERFHDAAVEMSERLAGEVHLTMPFAPDTNLVCLAINPVGNDSLAAMNRFGRRLFSYMRVDPDQPLQVKEFIGSYTSLQYGGLTEEHAIRILGALGVDPSGFVEIPEDPAREADHIFVLRHTLMNPWFMTGPGDRSYIDLYWEYLERTIAKVLGEREHWADPNGDSG